jgi:hypothetical protein
MMASRAMRNPVSPPVEMCVSGITRENGHAAEVLLFDLA